MTLKYIPNTDGDFETWQVNFVTKVVATPAAYGLLPADVTALGTLSSDWQTSLAAQTVAQDAAIAATQGKELARRNLESEIRNLAQRIQIRKATTDAQRGELGITIPDTNPTPSNPEYVLNLTPPNLILDWSIPNEVKVHFGINPSNERRNAKPAGIAGAKIWYRIETGPWTYVADDTNSPYTHNLPITEPTNVEYKAQWFDKKSRPGQFGESARCTVTPK
ncbi:MAG: hypothetical protein V1871_00505 [Planctomycetota bacterium]